MASGLSTSDRIFHGAFSRCATIADDLKTAVRGRTRNGEIRLLHSLDGGIADKLAKAVDDLGGATRLVVAAPFWNERVVDELCSATGLDHIFVHAHNGGTVEGRVGRNWPVNTTNKVHAIRLDIMEEAEPRKLHAKAFEVMCRRGRILLSGSANATLAALNGQNVEACIVRIQRERLTGWTFSTTAPPELRPANSDEDHNENEACGVLRAVLEGDEILGKVLTPRISGEVEVLQRTTEGMRVLGRTFLSEDGNFEFKAPSLELEAWKAGRLVLRLSSPDGRAAEGFISVAAFAQISRHAGALGRRLLAVLTGTEAPADVVAIMTWFHDDPQRLPRTIPMTIGGGGTAGNSSGQGTTVAVAELNSAFAAVTPGRKADTGEQANWKRFMDYVLAALCERRGPISQPNAGSGDESADDVGSDQGPQDDPAIERSYAAFEKLLEKLLSEKFAEQYAITAFDLTQYICDRLRPDASRVRGWLEQILATLRRVSVPPERTDDVASAIITLLGSEAERGGERTARGQLLRLGVNMDGEPPAAALSQGFQSVLLQVADWTELWSSLRDTRTFAEQIRAYVVALTRGQDIFDCRDLAEVAPGEWPIMLGALKSPTLRKRVLILDRWSTACPKCHMTLPSLQVDRLREYSVAMAKNCCGRVIIWPGGLTCG